MTSSQICLESPGPCSVLHDPCQVYTVRVAPRVNAAATVFLYFPLCRVLLTRPNTSKPQLSFVGLLAWYGIAISALVGF
jgi:hypothetical protein